ncbi:hypothetical protein GP677_28195, partial [Escherichia coli]|nr:hypothetical protein [Escherichia coli]MWL01809.1 hypothetical protein [Escherichia coli]
MTRPGDETPPEADPHQGPFESLPSSVPDDDLVDTFRLPGEPPRSTTAAPVHADGPASPPPEAHAAGQAGQDPAASTGASGLPDDGRPAAGQGVSPGPTDDSDDAPALQ